MRAIWATWVLGMLLSPAPLRAATPADPHTPVPRYSAIAAIQAVDRFVQRHREDPKEFVVSAVYGRPDLMRRELGDNYVTGREKEWAWFVTYDLPGKGNSTIVYRLSGDGDVDILIQVQ
jgi:hypothetical protein